MKTAVTGEDDDGHIVYNRALLTWRGTTASTPTPAGPTGRRPKARSSARSATSAQDFFLARSFRNLDDLNAQLDEWLRTIANARVHATTQRVVKEAFAAERNELKPLPQTPFDALLKLERRVSHDGLVSIGGNYYSVPDRTRRIVEVHQLPDIIRILDEGRVVAVHPVLEGRRRTRVVPEHRQGQSLAQRPGQSQDGAIIGRPGDRVHRRSLEMYQAIGQRLAAIGGRS